MTDTETKPRPPKAKAVKTEPKPFGMAMREVTITTGGWVDSQPIHQRPQIMKMIFSMAAEYGWLVRVGGQRWEEAA